MKTRYIHGPGFNDCSICDYEISIENPGKEVTTIENDVKFIDHICDYCFAAPEYQEIVKERNATVKNKIR